MADAKISSLAEDTAPAAADFVVTVDVSVGANKKVQAGNLPLSSAATTALALKAPLASPTFTGTPTAPTADPGTNTTQLATTAFVAAGFAAFEEVTLPIGQEDVADLVDDLALKAPLASPALTGTPTAPTASPGTNTTQLATTAFVAAAVGDAAGMPGGSTGQVQVNDDGAFAGYAGLTYDGSTLGATRIAVSRSYTDYLGSGTNSHILMDGLDGAQCNLVVAFDGDIQAKWRTDSEGNCNWQAMGAHVFYHGGDGSPSYAALSVHTSRRVGVGPFDQTVSPDGQLDVRAQDPARPGLVVRAFPSQSAPLVRLLDSDGTTALGGFGPRASLTPAHLADGSAPNDSLYYSTTASGVAYKSSGGTVTPMATTAYVASAIAALVNSAPSILDTLGEIATQLQADESTAAALATTVAGKAPLASPTFTGTVTIPAGISGLVKASSGVLSAATAGTDYATASQGTKADSAVQSISLATPNVLYTTPITFSVTAGAATGTLTLATQSANTVLAGPTTGTAATPTMRALVAADIPTHAHSAADVTSGTLAVARGGTGLATVASGKLLYASALDTLAPLALGPNLSITSGTLNAAGASIASTSSVLKGDGAGAAIAATAGTDYVTPAGTAGGQTIAGSTASAGALTLNSTAHATKGAVNFNGGLAAFNAACTLLTMPSGFGIGAGSSAGATQSVAIGNACTAGSGALAVGSYNAYAPASEAVAVGKNTSATGNFSTAIGSGATTNAKANSTAIGYGATATATNQIMLGTATETVALPGSLAAVPVAPATLAANTNNYSPGLGAVQRWSASAPVNITGMVAGSPGEIRILVNVGSSTITLTNQDASSTAANRWLTTTGADAALAAGRMAFAIYDATTAAWRVSILP